LVIIYTWGYQTGLKKVWEGARNWGIREIEKDIIEIAPV